MKSTGQMRFGQAVLCLGLLIGLFQSSFSVHVEVTDGNTTCIMADLSINFTVEYKTEKQGIAVFPLPEKVSVDAISTCGKGDKPAPLLVIKFGDEHSLSINFTKDLTKYQVDTLVFIYNLSDKTLFPGATENGTKEVSSKKTDISAQTKSYYRCNSPHLVMMGNVNATFYHISLEAYASSKNYSTNATSCSEDITPTSAPTTPPSTAPPTTAPVNPGTPKIGKYQVNYTSTGKPCLLANMGLQLNITYMKKDGKETSYVVNIDPDVKFTGNCTNSSATLILLSSIELLFNFTLNATTNKFYLGEVHANTTLPDAKDPNFNVDNSSLSYLQTTAHKSYKCNSKQTLQITRNFSIDTYNLQVQAFDIDKNEFGPAVECSEDQNGMLVPIVVGACLAGLVLIVLVAYLIGRKRSHAGYQTI